MFQKIIKLGRFLREGMRQQPRVSAKFRKERLRGVTFAGTGGWAGTGMIIHELNFIPFCSERNESRNLTSAELKKPQISLINTDSFRRDR